MRRALRNTSTALTCVVVLHTASGLLMPLAIGFCLVTIMRDRRVEAAAHRHPAARAVAAAPPRRRLASPLS